MQIAAVKHKRVMKRICVTEIPFGMTIEKRRHTVKGGRLGRVGLGSLQNRTRGKKLKNFFDM